jgi:hypothetical protein
MPADRGMAPVAAAIALDYASLPAAERSMEPRFPLTVVDTAYPDDTLAQLLAPYAMRGAVQHVGPNFEPHRLEPGWENGELSPETGSRHPVTSPLLERWNPAAAIFVAPDAQASQDIELFLERGVPFTSIAHTDPRTADEWHRWDAAQIMSGRPRRWAARDQQERPPVAEVEPYDYLMQRFIHRSQAGPPAVG